MVWLEAPLHSNFNNNELRKIFNACLHDVVKFHENAFVQGFKKIWDRDNDNFYVKDFGRFTNAGFNAYWAAADCTMKFMDTILWWKQVEPPPRTSRKAVNISSRFKWSNPELPHNQKPNMVVHRSPVREVNRHYNHHSHDKARRRLPFQFQFKLPTPPPL